jgi:hypothetical protein
MIVDIGDFGKRVQYLYEEPWLCRAWQTHLNLN